MALPSNNGRMAIQVFQLTTLPFKKERPILQLQHLVERFGYWMISDHFANWLPTKECSTMPSLHLKRQLLCRHKLKTRLVMSGALGEFGMRTTDQLAHLFLITLKQPQTLLQKQKKIRCLSRFLTPTTKSSETSSGLLIQDSTKEPGEWKPKVSAHQVVEVEGAWVAAVAVEEANQLVSLYCQELIRWSCNTKTAKTLQWLR